MTRLEPGSHRFCRDLRAVLNAIFYLLRSGCHRRLLSREFALWGTVYHYFQAWQKQWCAGSLAPGAVANRLVAVLEEEACPSVVIMDGQLVKMTERGGMRGFDAHKRLKGREASHTGRHAGACLAGYVALFPRISDSHDRMLATKAVSSLGALRQCQGWQLRIVRSERETWKGGTQLCVALEGTANSNKDYEYRMQTWREAMIDLDAICLTLNRTPPHETFQTPSKTAVDAARLSGLLHSNITR
jgi:hypothetical protein